MGSFGQVATGLAGGIAGFFIGGGPYGAVVGFSLGYSVGGLIFPPSSKAPPKSTNDFQVTGATEGAPPDIVYGRRRVKGNIIYFGQVHTETVDTSGGKGFGAAQPGSSVVRSFAKVHLTLAVGENVILHGVYNGKNQDWLALNSSYGGATLQGSTGSGMDFGYAQLCNPMPGVIHVYSDKFYLGENTSSFPPLEFDIEVLPSSRYGDPRSSMPSGTVNPASVLYSMLTDRWLGRLPGSLINDTVMQQTYDRCKAEGRGIAVLQTGFTSLDRLFETICEHVNGVIRSDHSGKIELYLLRNDNFTPHVIPNNKITNLQASAQTWDKVKNRFVATFPAAVKNFDQSTIDHKNQAVINMLGRSAIESSDLPWFVEQANVIRRLLELDDELSFPAPVIALRISNEFHKIRRGDVVNLNIVDSKIINKNFRVLEVRYADFGKEGIDIRCRMLRNPLSVSYTPPVETPHADIPDLGPSAPYDVMGIANPWWHPHGPPNEEPPGIPGGSGNGNGLPVGPFGVGTPPDICPPLPNVDHPGYPMTVVAARGSGRDVAYALKLSHSKQADLPVAQAGETIVGRWGYRFTLVEALGPSWRLTDDAHPLKLAFSGAPGESFGLNAQDATDANGFLRDQENSRWVMVIGGTEICQWTKYTLASGVYSFFGVWRAANLEYLFSWPAGTPVWIIDSRAPTLSNPSNYLNWAFRSRNIPLSKYKDPSILARVRAFAQAIDLNGTIQAPDEGFGGANGKTFCDRSGSKLDVSNVYMRDNETKSLRAPMPTCQAIQKTTGFDWRSWYAVAEGLGGDGDWLIEFPPFPNENVGVGCCVAYDTVLTPGKPFGPPVTPYERRLQRPTDAHFDTYVGVNGVCNGQTYHLSIFYGRPVDPVTSSPLRTKSITFNGSETFWPAFIYSVAEQIADGIVTLAHNNDLWFFVSVEGLGGQVCRPRLADKIGTWQIQTDPIFDDYPT